MRGRSTARAVLAFVLVATLVANPMGMAAVERSSPVGDAAAQDDGHDFTECTLDILWYGGDVDYPSVPDECGYSEIELAEIEENWLSIYTQAGVAHAAAESYQATYSNAVTSSNETAFMRAEHATFEAWTNGSTKVEAKTAGREAIRSYYATMQRNLVNRWNTQIASLENLHARDSSVSGDQIRFSVDASKADTVVHGITGWPTKNVTIADGSSMEVRGMTLNTEGGAYPAIETDYFLDSGQVNFFNDDDSASNYGWLNSIWVASPPETEYTSTTLLSYEHGWYPLWDQTGAYKTAASSRSDQLVETAWSELEAGNINATDYLSRITLIEKYATGGGGENATFSDVQAALMAQGFSAPNGSTAFMNITYEMVNRGSPKTSEGLLLSANGPPATNGTWEIGYQYNSTNIQGGQIVALLDGGSDEIAGNFTINQALDENGDPIENPTMNVPDRTYDVSTVEELNDRIAALGERIAELQNMTTSSGGGGGVGWPDLSFPNVPVSAILIGGAVFLVLFALSILKP